MKRILQLLVMVFGCFSANSQTCSATITASGETSFCNGGNVVLSANFSGGKWTQKANILGGPRMKATSFSIGNKGYVGTGSDNGLDARVTKDFWEYDPVANTWTQKADFGGVAREDATGFSIGNKGYIGVGFDGYEVIKDFWEYDPLANTWNQKADFGGVARLVAVGFSIGSKGYIGTGFNEEPKSDFWEYDPIQDSWQQKTSLPGPARSSAVAFSVGDTGYIGLGGSINYQTEPLKDFWGYDQATNTWSRKADFEAVHRVYASAFSTGSKGYVGIGLSLTYPFSYYKDFWEYDPLNNGWKQVPDFGGTARYNAVGFTIGNKGYVGTGGQYEPTGMDDFWEFDPEGGMDGLEYLWSNGATSSSITVETSGNYTVTVTNSAGCSATSLPVVVSVSQEQPVLYCPSDTVVSPTTLSGTVVHYGDPVITSECGNFSILQTAGLASGSMFPIGTTVNSFKASDAAGNFATCSFKVTVMNPYCSGDQSKVYVCHNGKPVCVKVNAMNAHLKHGDVLGNCNVPGQKPLTVTTLQEVKLYPNPTQGGFTLKLDQPEALNGTITIIDGTGNIIERKVFNKSTMPLTVNFNLGNRPRGYYKVKVETGSGVVSGILVLQ